MKISSKKTEGLLFFSETQVSVSCSKAAITCSRWRISSIFKFTSNGRQNKEFDPQIGKANTVLHRLMVSCSQNGSFVQTPQRSVFKSVFVPILINGHES